jgi:hypothetical protein
LGTEAAPADEELLTPEFDADTRTYDVEVGFEVDSTTVTVRVDAAPGDGGTRTLKSLTGATGADGNTSTLTVGAGKTRTFVAMVDHGVQDIYDDTKTNTSTGEYRINVMREKPKLAAVEDAEGTGLRLRYGTGQFDDDIGETDGLAAPDFGLGKMYDPDTMAYEAKIPYQHTTVSLHAMAGLDPPSDTIKVNWVSPTDANDGVIGHQVDLSDDVREKTVVVRAESGKDGRIHTEYRVTLTLMPTKLVDADTFALCEGDDDTCAEVTSTTTPGAGEIVLRKTGSGDLVFFDEDTMDYDAEVGYEVGVATLDVKLAIDADDPRSVEYTMPASDTSPVTSTLMVGDNVFKVDVGVTGNTSTYMVTLTRNEPEPQIQFTVLNSEGDSLGTGPLPVKLDAGEANSM